MIDNKEYELSIWKDGLEDGIPTELKLGVLGSTDFDSPIAAYDIVKKTNVNGEKTLTFKIPRYYYEDGEKLDNPYISLINSERKIKLRDGKAYPVDYEEDLEDTENRWSDFLIKSIDENKSDQYISIECKELQNTELGRNGWSITLDSELRNNFGTVKELGGRILYGSDWKMDESSSIIEGNVQPVVKAYRNVPEYPIPSITQISPLIEDKQTVELDNDIFYLFYKDLDFSGDTIKFKDDVTEIQLIYCGREIAAHDNLLDDDGVLIDEKFAYNYTIESLDFSGLYIDSAPTGFSCRKLVNSAKTLIEPVEDKYVELYKGSDNKDYYSYVDTTYLTSKIMKNYVANGSNFTSAVGWTKKEDRNNQYLFKATTDWNGEPSTVDTSTFINCLSFPHRDSDWSLMNFNRGPYTNKIELVGKKEFVVRVKGRLWDYTAEDTSDPVNIQLIDDSQDATKCHCFVGLYTYDTDTSTYVAVTKTNSTITDGEKPIDVKRFPLPSSSTEETSWVNKGYPVAGTTRTFPEEDLEAETPVLAFYVDSDQYYCMKITVKDDYAQKLSDTIYLGIGFHCPSNNKRVFYAEDIQLFEYIEGHYDVTSDEDFGTVYPTDTPHAEIIQTRRFYYVEDGRATYVDGDDLIPLYNNYESVRSLDVKEGNYFNNLTSLAEKFQGWISYNVKHYQDGKIMLDENNKPIKTVKISQFHINDEIKWNGFNYDVNLTNIKRQIDSKSTTSKLIVKNNNNKYAKNGICSIVRAKNNDLYSNIIYNFDYYITQGLIDQDEFNKYFYGNSESIGEGTGWYYQIGAANKNYYEVNQIIASLQTRINDVQEKLNYADIAYEETDQAVENYRSLYETALKSFLSSVIGSGNTTVSTDNSSYLLSWKYKYFTALSELQNYEKQKTQLQNSLAELEEQLNEYRINQEDYKNVIDNLNDEFYTKYSRFLQEGTWNDDSYTDDTMYYLDACKVSNQSAYPKITYDISVIDVGDDSEYEWFKFDVGNRSYVTDPQFFGYDFTTITSGGQSVRQIKSPHKKEIVITEKEICYDNPTQTKLVVRTYKDEFKELFSKITASVQSLQYAKGGYERASQVIEADGQVSIRSLEESLSNNSFKITSVNNESMEFGSNTGLQVSDVQNMAKITRLTSRGLVISQDGGLTWDTAISGDGINTHLLQAAEIETNKINIVSASGTPFIWNDEGLNAYIDGYDTANRAFVRFNQFGVFGVNNIRKGYTVNIELNAEPEVTFNLVNTVDYDRFKNEVCFIDEEDKFYINANFQIICDGATPTSTQLRIDQMIRHDNMISGTDDIYISSQIETVDSEGKAIVNIENLLFDDDKIYEKLSQLSFSDADCLYIFDKDGNPNYNWYKLVDDQKVLLTDEEKEDYNIQDNFIFLGNGEEKTTEEKLRLFVFNNFLFNRIEILNILPCQKIELKVLSGLNSVAFTQFKSSLSGITANTVITYDTTMELLSNKFNSLSEIKANSRFALTWDGLTMNNDQGERVFYADADTGNLNIAGKLTVKEGSNIAGWITGKLGDDGHASGIYKPKKDGLSGTGMAVSSSDDSPIFWAGYTGDNETPYNGGFEWPNNTKFYVTQNGVLYAKDAHISGEITANAIDVNYFHASNNRVQIGQWNVDSHGLYYNKDAIGVGLWGGTDMGSIAIHAGSNTQNVATAPFRVYYDGKMYASKGTIGGWTIDEVSLYKGEYGAENSAFLQPEGSSGKYTIAGYQSSGWVFGCGPNFGVHRNGTLYAEGAVIRGTLKAGTIISATRDGSGSTESYAKLGQAYILDSSTGVCTGSCTISTTDDTMANAAAYIKMYNYNMNGYDNSYISLGGRYEYGGLGRFSYLDITNGLGRFHGDWSGTSSISLTSDYNKKNTISSLTYSDSFFDSLRPVTYKYNDGWSDRLHCGFIAQEVKEAMDNANIELSDFAGLCIEYNEITGEEIEWRLRYEEFIALNTDQIQKLKRRVAQLEQEIENLKKS